MNLSIVIRCGTDERVANCLQSIKGMVEKIVVTNKKSTRIRQIATGHGARILEAYGKNVAEMQNIGISAAQNDFVLLIDSDCAFSENCISTMYRVLKQSPKSIVRGNLKFKANGAINKIIAKLRSWHDCDRAYTPLLAFHRKIAPSVGGYFFNAHCPFVEDYDFDIRRRHAGIPLIVREDAVAYHDITSLSEDLRRAWKYGKGMHGMKSQMSITQALADGIKKSIHVSKKYGLLAAAYYALVWKPTYLVSYYV